MPGGPYRARAPRSQIDMLGAPAGFDRAAPAAPPLPYVTPPWTPLSLGSKLTLWLRADRGVTGTAPVSAWADQSGNGNDFLASGVGPSLGSDALGAYLGFDGTSQAMQMLTTGGRTLASLISASAFALCVVFEATAISTNNPSTQANVALLAHGLGYWGVHLKSAGPTVNVYNFDVGDVLAAQPVATGATRAIYGRHASGKVYARVNGGTETSATNGATGLLTNVVNLGRAGTAAAYLSGKVREVIVCNADWAAGDQAALQSYVAGYGLAP